MAIAGTTNLLFYGSLDTVNSHAISFFSASLFLALLFSRPRNWLIIGMIGGLVSLVRAQDAILIILALPTLKKASDLVYLVTGALLAFLPQIIAWQILYGTFWVSPYINSYEGFHFLQPNILGVLFSPINGLVLWTPIVALGFIGFCLRNKTNAPLRLMALIVLLALYLVASWSTWWQGASYSARMLVGILPLIAFGLAQLFASLRRLRFSSLIITYGIIGPLTIINAILIIRFLLSS